MMAPISKPMCATDGKCTMPYEGTKTGAQRISETPRATVSVGGKVWSQLDSRGRLRGSIAAIATDANGTDFMVLPTAFCDEAEAVFLKTGEGFQQVGGVPAPARETSMYRLVPIDAESGTVAFVTNEQGLAQQVRVGDRICLHGETTPIGFVASTTAKAHLYGDSTDSETFYETDGLVLIRVLEDTAGKEDWAAKAIGALAYVTVPNARETRERFTLGSVVAVNPDGRYMFVAPLRAFFEDSPDLLVRASEQRHEDDVPLALEYDGDPIDAALGYGDVWTPTDHFVSGEMR